MKHILPLTAASAFVATPALAAKGPFLSLSNSDFVVLIAFIIFLGILAYFKVPAMLAGLLDQRAQGIASDIEEAKALEEEAKSLLADYKRKQKDVQEQANRIVAQAKSEASAAAELAKADLAASITRRLAAAEDQIASAQASAVKEVRDQAISVAVAASRDVIAQSLDAAQGNTLIDAAISQVETKLH